MKTNHTYAHSKSFERLKVISEDITNNFTSLQYLQTLDMFLWRALEPIHSECPSFFNNYFSIVVSQQTLKASTKFSSDDRSKLPIRLFNMLSESSQKKAFIHAQDLHINRGILFGFLSIFLKKLEKYSQLHSPFVELDPVYRRSEMYCIEQLMGVKPGGSLYGALQQTQYWENKARDFKGKIIQKYTRMAIMNAKMTYADYNHYVKLDDVVQIYLMIVSKAIDRCDARQGVLTTFIQNWFKSARSEVAALAKGQLDHSYESLSEEHGEAISNVIGYSLPDTTLELQQQISYLSKIVDKQGYIRATLHIPEFLTSAEKEKLNAFVIE